MDKIRKELKKKLRTYQLVMILLALMPSNLRLLQKLNIFVPISDENFASGTMDGFIIGLHLGLIAILAFMVIKLSKAFSDDGKLKKYYTYINDERNRLIKTKSGIPLNIVNAYFIMLIGYLLQSTSIYISYTSIVIANILIIQSIVLKIYYKKNM